MTHVVGIGASAGGLEALQEFAASLVSGAGLAYVVAQHLAPEHRSLIVELVGHVTALPVLAAVDGAPIQADVITISPPNHDLTVDGNRLRLSTPVPRFGPSPCIDLLLESIADHWGERGVGVVLSGTGSDGARGIRALSTAGGLTLAQSPESAKFDAMPRAAIGLGGVDLVLAAGAMGPRLAELIGSGTAKPGERKDGQDPLQLEAVTAQLKHSCGIDFSQYKKSTLSRQVQRRMAVRQVGNLEEYLPLLATEGDEARRLVHNLLVAVTAFFRDPQVYGALKERLGDYVSKRTSPERLRVWVPGCASGEEVYSIAMVISAVLGHPADLAANLKIFATDLDEKSLAIARRARYPVSAARAIPDEYRERFVIEHGSEIEISEALRACAVFAQHDVGEHPPFPSLDLISCRNTLIYFTLPMQERVIERFRFGLLPGGLLLLGNSEVLGRNTTGFAMADAEHGLYTRTAEGARRPRAARSPLAPRPSQSLPAAGRVSVLRESVPEQHMALLEALTRALCAPALVLDEGHDLVEVLGDVSPFCRLPEGRMKSSAHAYLRPELQTEARALLVLARADGLAVSSQALQLEGIDGTLRLEARQLWVGESQLTVLSFLRLPPTGGDEPKQGQTRDRDAAFDQEIERLEHELLASQDTLRRSLAELEQTNEELEASSEELLASSEELHSSNEELEASNEELQATNEELGTLNQQLGSRSDQLEQLNVELENIQISLSQGMVIVDSDLRVTRFSPLAVRVFGLVDADIGQPLLDAPTTIPLPGLKEALKAVADGGQRQTIEASNEDVANLAQVLPFLERDGRRRGVIVTLTEVSEMVAVRQAAEATLLEFSTLTNALDEVVWKWDQSCTRLLYATKRIHAMTGWTSAELCDRPELLKEAIALEDRVRVGAARDLRKGHWTVTYRITSRDGRQIWVKESAKVVRHGAERFVVGTLADVTAAHALEARANELTAIFESVFHSESFGVAVLDEGHRVVMANAVFCAIVGFDLASIVGVCVEMLCPEAEFEALILETRESGDGKKKPKSRPMLPLKSRDGGLQWLPVEVRTPRQPSERGLISLIVHPPL